MTCRFLTVLAALLAGPLVVLPATLAAADATADASPAASPAPSPEIVAESPEPLIPGANFPLRFWEVERIAPDVYGFRYSFYRTLFVVTPAGVIVADPLSDKAARQMRAQIRALTDQPVKYVAYSHSHFDHAAGGAVFREEGATFIAQEQCLRNWQENRRADVVLPDVTFKDEYRIELGGKVVQMNWFGPAHDNCLTTLLIKPERLLMTVDTGNLPTGWAMFYNPGVSEDRVWNMGPWFRRVEELVRREGVETVIGAHMNVATDERGRPTLIRATTGPARTLTERREFWEAMLEAARAELALGTPAGEVPDRLVAKGVLADRIVGYDGPKMRQLFQRMVVTLTTGE